jgi:hypothetical protein
VTDHCTPQTARALKAAGFNQPEQKPGQFWYLQNKLYVIVSILTDTAGQTAILYEISEESRDVPPLPVRLPFSDVFVYSATATDIMRASGELELYCQDFDDKNTFTCTAHYSKSSWATNNFNPAEACAEEWISCK